MLKLPYERKTISCNGGNRSFARATCGSCGSHADHALTGTHNPEMVVKHWRRDGWTIDFGPARHNRCPACSKRPKVKGDPEALLRPLAEVIPMKTAPAPAAAAATAARDLTPDEKAAVRRLLDSNFDDAAGMYLDGYGDRRVAEECNVPAACVTRLRELAYGPIRIDPELAALKADAADLAAKVAALADRIKAAEARAIGKVA